MYVCMYMCVLCIFYFRLFHHPRLYKYVHKVHHEWTAPVSITSSYCHPLEHLIVNLLPIATGPLLLGNLYGNHLALEWLWVTIAVGNTTIAHCGFHFPFFPSSEAHDFHHKKLVSITYRTRIVTMCTLCSHAGNKVTLVFSVL